MPTGQISRVVREIHKLADVQALAQWSDGQLLDHFVRSQDENAFEQLLRRHGPMVLGVCRRILTQPDDAEDAYQATFLVLVRKAASIHPPEMVGNWLYGVACRTALKARAMAHERRVKEKQGDSMNRQPSIAGDAADAWTDLQDVLDDELERLPEKYRALIVLCDIEGRSRKEVADALNLPEGTLSSRLATARKRLAQRLARRGITLSAGAIATLLTQNLASASVPPALNVTTLQSVSIFLNASTAAGAIAPNVAALAEGVLKAMFLAKLKTVSTVIVLVGFLLAGVAALVSTGSDAQAQQTQQAAQAEGKKDDAGDKEKKPVESKGKEKEKDNKAFSGKDTDPVTSLKDRLKKHESEIAKIRRAMLKEIDEEIDKVETALKKAREAQKAGDRTAFQKAGQLTGEKIRLQSLRNNVEHGMPIGGFSASRPIENQLGLHLTTPSSTLRQQLALQKDQGLVLDRVTADSAAAKAGLQAHDVITEVDGKTVTSDVGALRKTLTASAGKSIDVTVIRAGKQQTIKGLSVPE